MSQIHELCSNLLASGSPALAWNCPWQDCPIPSTASSGVSRCLAQYTSSICNTGISYLLVKKKLTKTTEREYIFGYLSIKLTCTLKTNPPYHHRLCLQHKVNVDALRESTQEPTCVCIHNNIYWVSDIIKLQSFYQHIIALTSFTLSQRVQPSLVKSFTVGPFDIS